MRTCKLFIVTGYFVQLDRQLKDSVESLGKLMIAIRRLVGWQLRVSKGYLSNTITQSFMELPSVSCVTKISCIIKHNFVITEMI